MPILFCLRLSPSLCFLLSGTVQLVGMWLMQTELPPKLHGTLTLDAPLLQLQLWPYLQPILRTLSADALLEVLSPLCPLYVTPLPISIVSLSSPLHLPGSFLTVVSLA